MTKSTGYADHKVVGELRFAQNQSQTGIAQQIGKSVAAAEMMIVRIRRRLRDCVEKSMALEKASVP